MVRNVRVLIWFLGFPNYGCIVLAAREIIIVIINFCIDLSFYSLIIFLFVNVPALNVTTTSCV